MKVSKKKLWKLGLVAFLVLMMFLSLSKFHKTECVSIDISIKDSTELHFIDKNDVMALIYSVNSDILGYLMDSINIYSLENKLKEHPFIRNVAIYKTISGKLKIEVEQRHPVLMVINNNNRFYYIDSEGIVFQTSEKCASQVIVANGFIKDNFDFSKGQIYKINTKDDTKYKATCDLYKLSLLIQRDDFWRDQIEQIFVNSLGEYELVPMLGTHILALGSIEDYQRKMYILKEFYFSGLKKAGWNTYKQISVKYKNQIVCKRT